MLDFSHLQLPDSDLYLGRLKLAEFVARAGVCTVYHLLEGRGFVCSVFDPASVHGPKQNTRNFYYKRMKDGV